MDRLGYGVSGRAVAVGLSLCFSGALLGACGGSVVTIADGQGGSQGPSGFGATGNESFGTGGNGFGVSGAPFTGAGGSAVIGGAAGSGGAAPYCVDSAIDPVTLLADCSNGGWQHRPKALICSGATNDIGSAGAAGTSSGEAGATSSSEVPTTCATDSDCSALPHGYCEDPTFPGGPPLPKICLAGCVQDSDCHSGFCECAGPNGGRCVDSNCHIDADCGPNSFCASVVDTCGIGLTFACTRPTDECLSAADCPVGYNCFNRRCEDAICVHIQ